MVPVECRRRLRGTFRRPFHQRCPLRIATADVVIETVGIAAEQMLKQRRGDEDECIDQRRADIRCARSIRPAEPFSGGPDQQTEQRASEVSNAPRETEQQTDRDRRFNEPRGGNKERGVHRDQTQPHVKPRFQPARLCVRGILQVADIMRGKPRLPFQVGIDRHENAESSADCGRGDDQPRCRFAFGV